MNDHRTSVHTSRICAGAAWRAAAAAALLGSVLIAAPAQATPGSGFTAVQTWKGNYGDMDVKLDSKTLELELRTKGEADVHVTRNAIAVGGQSGWHMHPGPSLITVTVGSITAYDSHDPLCQPKTYTVGQGFIDSGEHAHLLRNDSGAPAETVAVQFLPDGGDRRIDAAKPNNCSF